MLGVVRLGADSLAGPKDSKIRLIEQSSDVRKVFEEKVNQCLRKGALLAILFLDGEFGKSLIDPRRTLIVLKSENEIFKRTEPDEIGILAFG